MKSFSKGNRKSRRSRAPEIIWDPATGYGIEVKRRRRRKAAITPGNRISFGSTAGLRRPFAQHVAHEPISTFIGLTAFISSLGASAAVAGAIGGFIITAPLSLGVSIIPGVLTHDRA